MNNHSQSVREPFFLLRKPNTEDDAGRELSPATSHLFEELYRAFWNPFFGYLRSEGYSQCDTEDLLGGMFAHLIECGRFDGARCPDARCSTCRNPRCYSYLLSGLKNHIRNEQDRTQSLRRGREYNFVSWEDDPDGDAVRCEASCSPTPVEILQAQWASEVMDQSLSSLRIEVTNSLKPGLFDCLEDFVSGDRPHGNYATLAAVWGLSEPALRMTVCRLRRRLAKILIAALAAEGYSVHSNGHNRITHCAPRQSSSATVARPIEPVREQVGLALA